MEPSRTPAASCPCSQQHQMQGREQTEDGSRPAQPRRPGRCVAQVHVAALVGVVEVQAGRLLLSAPAALGRDGTALLVQHHAQRAYGGRGGTFGMPFELILTPSGGSVDGTPGVVM